MQSRSVARALAVAIALAAFVAVFNVATGAFFPVGMLYASVRSPPIFVAVYYAVSSGAMVAVPFLYAFVVVPRPVSEYVRLRQPTTRDLKIGVVGFVVAITVALASEAVVTLVPVHVAQNGSAVLAATGSSVALVFAAASVVLIAPVEEFVFRGVIQTRLAAALPRYAAIGIAALIFAVSHVFALQGNGKAFNLLLLFVVGCLFGVAYEYSGSLVVPIFVHGLYDAVLYLAPFVHH